MEMWCPDDMGRDSWDWVGPPAWWSACFKSPKWAAPRLLKTEPPQIVLLLLLFRRRLDVCVWSRHNGQCNVVVVWWCWSWNRCCYCWCWCWWWWLLVVPVMMMVVMAAAAGFCNNNIKCLYRITANNGTAEGVWWHLTAKTESWVSWCNTETTWQIGRCRER